MSMNQQSEILRMNTIYAKFAVGCIKGYCRAHFKSTLIAL